MIDKEFQLKDISKDYWRCENCGFFNKVFKQNNMKKGIKKLGRVCSVKGCREMSYAKGLCRYHRYDAKKQCLLCGMKYYIFQDNNPLIPGKAKSSILLRSKLG